MDKRCAERFESSLLPAEFSRVRLVLKDGANVESTVVNICSHGMGVEISPSSGSSASIRKNETLKVYFSSEPAGFSGLCVHTDTGTDDSTRLGIYFYYPNEQNTLYQILKNISLPVESGQEPGSREMDFFVNRRFVKHEWEERVQMLCNSDDPDVRSIGLQEMEVLRLGQTPKNCDG
jgi:hypothetical protein